MKYSKASSKPEIARLTIASISLNGAPVRAANHPLMPRNIIANSAAMNTSKTTSASAQTTSATAPSIAMTRSAAAAPSVARMGSAFIGLNSDGSVRTAQVGDPRPSSGCQVPRWCAGVRVSVICQPGSQAFVTATPLKLKMVWLHHRNLRCASGTGFGTAAFTAA